MATQHKQAELCMQGRYVSVYSHVRYNYTFHPNMKKLQQSPTVLPHAWYRKQSTLGLGQTRVSLH